MRACGLNTVAHIDDALAIKADKAGNTFLPLSKEAQNISNVASSSLSARSLPHRHKDSHPAGRPLSRWGHAGDEYQRLLLSEVQRFFLPSSAPQPADGSPSRAERPPNIQRGQVSLKDADNFSGLFFFFFFVGTLRTVSE